MQTRKLGYTDLELTTIGLGTWAIGGSGWQFAWGPQDDKESIDAIHRAIDLGINWIDTAAVYGLGHSEEIIRKALEGHRNDVYIATKCGRVWNPGDPRPFGRLTAMSVRKEAEDSLRRLGVDVIDLYQIHWPQPDEQIEEAWTTMADLVKEGKVRYIGVSNFDVSQLERIRRIHPVASLQPPYSMIRREVEQELLAYCKENDIGVIVYSPMQAGILTGKFTRERVEALPEDDWRRTNRHYNEPELSANLKLVDGLRTIAERYERTPAELAIAWVLRRPEVTAAIVGARRPSQIEETARAGDWNLMDEVVAEIENLLAERERSLTSGLV